MEISPRGLLPEALILGIPDIDAQHQNIFFQVETLKAACLAGNALPIDMANALLAALDNHFLTEEGAAREAALDFAEHGEKHRETLHTLTHWIHLIQSGRRDVFSLLRYLEVWFERHILEEDKPLACGLLEKEPRRP